jgi:hypothetical protein
MKSTQGQANPQLVNELLKKKLGSWARPDTRRAVARPAVERLDCSTV